MFVFFKQKTAYEMRISDWRSDVCSSDLVKVILGLKRKAERGQQVAHGKRRVKTEAVNARDRHLLLIQACNDQPGKIAALADKDHDVAGAKRAPLALEHQAAVQPFADLRRSEEHTSELQSLMRSSYAVFCLKKKIKTKYDNIT